MKINILYATMIAASSFVLVACSDRTESQVPTPHADGIVFRANAENLAVRSLTDVDALTTAFEEGDEIGVFAVKRTNASTVEAPTSSNSYKVNVKYTRQSDGTWTSSDPIPFPIDGSTLDFYAYFPYNSGVTDPTAIVHTVATDQNVSTFEANDLMTAQYVAGLTSSSTNIPMLTFSHKLALMQVTVTGASADFTAQQPVVSILGMQPTATQNLNLSVNSGAPVTSGTVVDIAMRPVSTAVTSARFWAYVPTQSIAENAAMISIDYDGDNYVYTLATAGGVSLSAANLNRFKISIDATQAMGMTVTLTDWTSGVTDESVAVKQ